MHMQTANPLTQRLGNVSSDALDVLFVSERGLWPMDQGYRVHGSQMARALAAGGLRVAMTTYQQTDAADTAGMPCWLRDMLIDWPQGYAEDALAVSAGWSGLAGHLRHRLAQRQGVAIDAIAGLHRLVRQRQPGVVIALGLHGTMLLASLRKHFPHVTTAWYAADEPTWFHLSCLGRDAWRDRPARLMHAGIALLMQRLFLPRCDLAIGVSPLDTRLLRAVGGARRAVTIRNGVDLKQFSPDDSVSDAQVRPRSLVFWGRLDFEPNVDAVCWFASKVWPRLRLRWPDATWQIVGKNAVAQVRRLGEVPGIEVVGEVPDIRPYAHAAAATILPMRCGGGIKNKLLEAAAMGLPILASPRATRGLNLPATSPAMLTCQSPDQWIEAARRVWCDTRYANQLRQSARQWVAKHHTWQAAATELTDAVNDIAKCKLAVIPQRAMPDSPNIAKAA